MRILLTGFSVLALTACAAAPQQESNVTDVNQEFTELAEQAWEYNRSQRHPEDGLLDISPDALAERYTNRRDYYQQLEAIDEAALSDQNRINRDMIMYALANQIDQYEYNMHYIPFTNETGFHSSIANLPNYTRFASEEDYRNYLNRLEDVPGYFEQQMEYMREGLATGMTQPRVVLTGFTEGILSYVQPDPRDSVFYAPFASRPAAVSAEVFAELEMEAQTVIATQVNVAYQNFYDFMSEEYLPNTRENIAAFDLPQGEEFYRNRTLHYTTTEMTPEQIHQIGLNEVARIRAEMMEVIEEVGFEGTFDEFVEFLRSDRQFYVETPEQLLKEASYIAKQADAALPALFNRLPRKPYGVAPVPAELAPNYTTGRYAGTNRDDQPGYYWVNTYALDRRPLYVLEALTLHESVPGHHLQIALAREMENVPDYRRDTYISAFGEGWGLYAEYLGIEAGFYQDPYSNFGRLTYEMWRAARLVVDTGMHTMGWTRDQAVEFLASNTALSMHNVNTEIDRYISWPAQALSYKLGELKIKELRAEAEAALGNEFDLREFHDEVLINGSIPLQTLEQHIRNYIAEKSTD